MGQRTLSCICLGPTGNVQGHGHWFFMSLTLGEKLIRHRWTKLPMPLHYAKQYYVHNILQRLSFQRKVMRLVLSKK
jgi:hypothetical protein